MGIIINKSGQQDMTEVYNFAKQSEIEILGSIPFVKDLVQGSTERKSQLVKEAIENAKVGDSFQFMRNGYFTVDKKSTDDKKIFNLTVTLKDSYKPTV